MHLAHRCIQAQPLSSTVNMNGELKVVDTTIPNYTIKNVFNYSGKGKFFTGVCLEGGSSWRKEYFRGKDSKDGKGYKGNRSSHKGAFFEGCDLAVNLMLNGQVSLYRLEHMEADDMIYSVIQKIKAVDQTTPIDVITNDSDLLPLVDDQVSVYMRGTREHAEPGCPTRKLYYQVTPETWDEYLSYTSAYKNYLIPYNSMLLFKMIRGDNSDNVVSGLTGYGAKKYSRIMQQMYDEDVDFPNIFRYGVDFDTVIAPALRNYFTDDEIEKMKYVYTGINLQYNNVVVPKQIEAGYLQQALAPLKIHILK